MKISDFKRKLKQIDFFSFLNSKIKAFLTYYKRGYLHLYYYIKNRNSRYNDDEVIEIFKKQLAERNLGHFPVCSTELKIFWVGTSYNQDNSGLLQALRKFGKLFVYKNHTGSYGIWNNNNTVGIYDKEVVEKNDLALKAQIEDALATTGIDVLFGQMWAGRISSSILGWVRQQGIVVINLSMDDRLPEHWGIREGVRLGSVGLGENVDIVLTTSSETCSWYMAEKIPSIFSPLASSLDLFYELPESKRDIDILFVGNKYGIREKIINHLKRQGFEITVYGAGWENGVADFDLSVNLSKRAKIILGVGTVGHCSDLYTLKLRDFDAPMSGALYITHRNTDLATIFKEGDEMEFYQNLDELTHKLNYYLNNPDQRIFVAKKGQKKVITHYEWQVLLSKTFLKLGLIK